MGEGAKHTNNEDSGAAGPSEEEAREHFQQQDERKGKNQLERDRAIIYVGVAGVGFAAAMANITSSTCFAVAYVIVGVMFIGAILCVVTSFSDTEKKIDKSLDRINKHIREKGSTWGLELEGEDVKSSYNVWAYNLFRVALVALTFVFLMNFFVMEGNDVQIQKKENGQAPQEECKQERQRPRGGYNRPSGVSLTSEERR